VGATSFGVRTTSETFGAWMDETLSAYRVRTEEWPEYSVVLHGGEKSDGKPGRRRFHVLYRGIGPLVRTLELPTVGRTLLAEFESRLLEERSDAIFSYAALLSWRGVHMLTPSWLPAYLGRLGRKVAMSGLSMPLAAWVAIDPSSGRVIGAPETLDVPDRAIQRLAETDGSCGSLTPLWPATEVPVDAVITYVEGLQGLELGSRGDALYRLTGRTPNASALGGAALHGLGRLVEGARAYELGMGRPQQMLEAVLAVAGHEAAHQGAGRSGGDDVVGSP
jgi:hypothetical protein